MFPNESACPENVLFPVFGGITGKNRDFPEERGSLKTAFRTKQSLDTLLDRSSYGADPRKGAVLRAMLVFRCGAAARDLIFNGRIFAGAGREISARLEPNCNR
jgi:hypothetical protein